MNAPAMPMRVVATNPTGSFGPGETNLAITPATKPITIVQKKPIGASLLKFGGCARFCSNGNAALKVH